MIISSQWLNDYISLDGLSTQDIAKALTSIGLEVESIKETALLDPLIVMGKVLQAEKHPNADSLRVCKVDVGSETLDIVCGAANARAGIYVAVAQKGATLPDGLKIKATKIRGESSNGMLCSKRELGISEEHDGIMEWSSAQVDLGKPVHTFLQTPDAIMELNVTPNRSDCTSYIGVARDLAAKLGRPLQTPKNEHVKATEKTPLTIKIENSENCGRFSAVLLKNVKALPSPLWLQKRMDAAGIRSINLIVDATNYTMLECGQPIHAYDRRFVKGDTLKVSSGSKDKFQTLDDAEIQLQEEDILICDSEKIVGLAGIMGGKNSEIKDDTTEVILEVAHFSMQKIRKTARRLALHSDASYRFERGVDIANIPNVLQRVTSLIFRCLKEQGHEGATVASDFYDVYSNPVPVHKIALRLSRVRMMIANPVFKQEDCVKHLQNLGFSLVDEKDERMLFEVPTWRNEIIREIDLIEEIARMEGYDSIPYEVPRMNISGQKEDPYIEFVNKAKQSIAVLGLNEVMTYPFVGKADYEKLRIPSEHGLFPSIRLANALNEQQAFMQTLIIPNIMNALVHNRNRGSKGVRLFEVSHTYFSSENAKWTAGGEEWKRFLRPSRLLSAKAKSEAGRVIEREILGGVLDQPFTPKEWDRVESSASFFHGKELLSALLKNFGIMKVEFVPCDAGALPFVHPNAASWIVFGRDRLGWVGELHPETAHAYDLGSEAPVCFELDLETVFEVHEKLNYKIKQPLRFPSVVRDLALLLSKEVTYKEFYTQALKFPGKKHLKDFRLFDLYEGERLGEGMKSFAASCTFQSAERTLTDEEVESELAALLGHLKSKLNAVQR